MLRRALHRAEAKAGTGRRGEAFKQEELEQLLTPIAMKLFNPDSAWKQP